ncbi:HAD family hydrolase [Vaginisenegalia massiliensis]|uniref:HAD family hydrolase n=1 Tax=Vaginisenegalia massiliensis TaxID=2058294 RepID=UPI000F52C993|nr:HAD family phosphatase [Vaginisenegalia massiliensis]
MKIDQFDAVIFDMDGTIADSEYAYFLGWRDAFKKYDVPIADCEIKSWSGLSAEATSKAINRVTRKPELIPILRQHRQDYFFNLLRQGQVEMKPYLIELLEYLKQHDKKIGLATSTYADRACPILEKFGIKSYFDVVNFGNQVSHLKPAPDIYLKTLVDLSCSKNRSLAIEDSESGITSAFRAGITVAVIPDSSFEQVGQKKYQNVFGVFQDFNELKRYLKTE